MSQNGKVAIITGGAQGLGKAFAQQLLDRGAKVALLDVNEALGQETLAQFAKDYGSDKAVFFKCDVTDKDALKDCFQKAKDHFSGLDIVINNAGIAKEGDGWELAVEINLMGVIRGTFLALEMLDKQTTGKGGVVVNVASMAGLSACPLTPVYCGTKGGVVLFSLSVASDPNTLEKKGVRVNLLCPTFADTAIVNQGKTKEKEEAIQTLLDRVGGMMTTEYVASNMMELIEDETKHGDIMKLSPIQGKAYHTLAPTF